MLKLAPFAIAAVLALGVTSAEAGWKRQVNHTGPNGGVVAYSGGGSCAGGTCSAGGTWTGPNGGTASHAHTATCAGGTCTTQGCVTGPSGRVWKRSGSITRN